jgi:preprotein translocase subunit SecE
MANKNTKNKKKKKVERVVTSETKAKSKKDKKRAAQANKNAQKKKRTSIIEYLKGVRLEMKKVVWPTKKELGSYTIVVVGVCAFFSIMFWAVDSGFLMALKGILGINM